MVFDRRLRRAVISRFSPSLARIPNDKDDLPLIDDRAFQVMYEGLQRLVRAFNHHIIAIFPEHARLYADYETWLCNELRSWAENILFDGRTLQRGLFNPEFLNSVWRRCLSGLEVNLIGKIAPLMTYEMLLRRFFDP